MRKSLAENFCREKIRYKRNFIAYGTSPYFTLPCRASKTPAKRQHTETHELISPKKLMNQNHFYLSVTGDGQYFRVRPNNSSVLEGGEVIISCEVGNRVGTVQWVKDGFAYVIQQSEYNKLKYKMYNRYLFLKHRLLEKSQIHCSKRKYFLNKMGYIKRYINNIYLFN